MSHFGFTKIKNIIGEIGTTTPYYVRSFIATERINFGQLVQSDQLYDEDSRQVKLFDDLLRPSIGVAAYQPTSKVGYYEAGDLISVITEGDVPVKIRDGDSFYVGDSVYVVNNTGLVIGEAAYRFSNSGELGSILYGSFLDGGTSAIDDDVFKINFKPVRLAV